MEVMKRFGGTRMRDALLAPALVLSLALSAGAADLSGSYSWKPVKIGAGGFVRGMMVHPTNANVRYARGDVDNIYRWDNTNSIWKPMKVSGCLPASVTAAPARAGGGAIAVDPSNANVVLCAFTFHRSADIQATNPDVPLNVYRSTNGGQTFVAGNMALSGDDLWDETRGERLIVDPNNGNVVYLGSKSHGLWRSMDGGLTWSNVTVNGAPASNSDAVKPYIDKGGGTVSFLGQTVSKRVYIIMNFGPVLQSDDGGNSWTNVSDVEYVGKNVIASTLDQNGNLFVGDIPNYGQIAKRTRAGVWSSIANPPQGITGLVVDPANANRMFVIGGGGLGLARSTNGGATWTRLGATPNFSSTQEIQWLRPSASRPNGHWVSTAGLYMDPTGRIWVPGGNDGVITFMPNDAVDSDATPPTWVSNSQGIEELVGHAIVIPPGGNPICTSEDEGPFTILNPDAFTAKHTNLNYWDPANTPHNGLTEGQDLAYCPNQPHYVVTTSDNGGYGVEPVLPAQYYSGYSNDGGLTWNKFASLTNGTHPCPLYCGLIAVSPRAAGHQNDAPGSDKIVWAPGGIVNVNTAAPFYSTDGGAHWTQTHSFDSLPTSSTINKCGVNYTYLGFQNGTWSNLIYQHLLEADPLIPGTFYYIATRLGFWKSTDGGVTWVQQAATNLPDNQHQSQLHANPNASGDLWFADGFEGGSPPHGLYHTTNGGASFTRNANFDNAWQVALGKASVAGGYPTIFVYGKMTGDANWGVFRSTDTGATWDRISFYPTGLIDHATGMGASWDTFGQVFISFQGNSVVYGAPSGGSPPPVPTGLTATAGNAQVALTWNASSGATAYDVKRSTVSGSGYATITSPTGTSYTNTGLTNGTTYYYVVAAKNASGSSANSTQASATPTATVVPQAQIPAGTATVDGTVEAGWSAATAYTLTKTTGTVSGSSDCSATYKAMWDATNLYVLADVTDDVKKNDSTNVYDDDAVEVYLDADHNGGTSYDANDRQMIFGWGDAAAVEGQGRAISGVTFAKADPTGTTYRIEIKIPWAVEAFTPAANAIIGIDVHVDDDDDGTARDGKVIWNDGTDGAWGNPSLFGTGKLLLGVPPVPTGLTATAGNAQVALSWNASSGATAYDVKRSTVSGSGYATITSPTGTSYTNTGLTNGTTYYYVVAAKNAAGSSANSSQVSATPQPPADTTQYNFEAGTQNWGTSAPATVASSTTRAYLGTHSLAFTLNTTGAGTPGTSIGGSPGPSTPAGAIVSYHVWIPTGSPITNVTVYLQGGSPNFTWTGSSYPIANLTAGAWNTLTVTCPASGSAPLGSLGLQATVSAAWTGTIYVDSVNW
jgi:fibronectin type 3 domain-containing protein